MRFRALQNLQFHCCRCIRCPCVVKNFWLRRVEVQTNVLPVWRSPKRKHAANRLRPFSKLTAGKRSEKKKKLNHNIPSTKWKFCEKTGHGCGKRCEGKKTRSRSSLHANGAPVLGRRHKYENGEWSMPVRHKASPFRAQAVKRNMYIGCRMQFQISLTSGKKCRHFQKNAFQR